MILPTLPKFCVNKPEELLVASKAFEACLCESTLRIGKVCNAEACEDAKCEIKRANVKRPKRPKHARVWQSEVGYKPECAAGILWRKALRKMVNLRLSEAVKEEMGDDQVGGCGLHNLFRSDEAGA
jgi:hypothetical protein